ncbi:MAG TPA: 9-O-acetylesterase, partial [Phaeodactylibacter sp.]|nr:9-O-acetylesterase [Phaeodactylibacter sp.]
AKNKGESEHSKWIAKFNTMDEGVKNDEYIWANPNTDYSQWKPIRLPGLWETSGIASIKTMDGVMWFTRTFEIPSLAAASEIMLSLGPIDDSDRTWINGKLVGETYNRYNKNRDYKIDKAVLKVGKNRITIRVEDYVGGGGLSTTDENVFLALGEDKISLAGMWKYHVGMIPSTPFDASNFGPNNFPTCLYNGMIAPMTDFPIKGVIWYQGETNTYRAYEYRDLFQRWIKDWRKAWHNNTLPILFVQLANYKNEEKMPIESQWAELREAQTMALKLPNTAMITAIDIGEAKSIHPVNKQEVGRRLSLAALNEVYGKNVKYKGPSYTHMKKSGKYIDIFFEDTYEGLKVTDKFSYVFGFSIAGEDKKFHWAKAEIIDSNQIRVWSNSVENPAAVRYAWQDNPQPANVFNSEGFPMFPFRTDDWKLSTFGITRE